MYSATFEVEIVSLLGERTNHEIDRNLCCVVYSIGNTVFILDIIIN